MKFPRRGAFTLIELLVVIAIIAVLAALLFPAGAWIKNSSMIRKAETELQQVATAIENYKTELGHYPPDNPNNPANNALYFELMGTVLNGNNYETKDGTAKILATSAQSEFGRGGFVNCTRNSDGDSSRPAKKFINELKPNQSGDNSSNVRVLSCSVLWPTRLGSGVAGVPELNPWRYNSSNPANNHGGFDLWVDIYVGGKTQRVSNWSKKAEIVF